MSCDETCKNCAFSQIVKMPLPYGINRRCVAYGVEVNDDDSCQNIVIKSEIDDEEIDEEE